MEASKMQNMIKKYKWYEDALWSYTCVYMWKYKYEMNNKWNVIQYINGMWK